MNSTSYKKICSDNNLVFVKKVKNSVELKEDEYYALMVTDHQSDNPNVKGVDIYSHEYLIGLERPSGNMGVYISKNFYRRKAIYRGNTIIVKVTNPTQYTILT